MSFRIFIIAAIVLIVFAIIATAATTGKCLGVTWDTWICAALLAYFVDLLLWERIAGVVTTNRQV